MMPTLRFPLVALALAMALLRGSPVCADPAPVAEKVSIPARAAGQDWRVVGLLYRPEGKGPFPLVIFSHGRSGKAEKRAKLQYPVPLGHVSYWMRKGFAVLAPIRPGYGETGGADIESSGNRLDRDGQCAGAHDYRRVARNAGDILESTVNWARAQPWINGRAILLVGQSVGGLATVSAGARTLPGVVAYINFSGGTGGDPERRPAASCFPEVLEQVYGEFGKTTRIPNIWLYAANDQFWGEDAPVRWHDAFAKAGGAGDFVKTAPVPNEDGHRLMLRGGRLWGVPVDRFVSKLGIAR